ncbi:MAG: tetratricopeptide repeat protein [Francisellaceae bacterium]
MTKRFFIFSLIFIILIVGLLIFTAKQPETDLPSFTSVPTAKTEADNKSQHDHHFLNTSLSPKAAFELGIYYTKNKSENKSSLKKAIDYIQYSAATGYAEAQFKLGLMYFQGIALPANQAVGFYWIKKAAENNYPEAQLYLAYMYKNGIGTRVNMFQYAYWLDRARDNGIVNPSIVGIMHA